MDIVQQTDTSKLIVNYHVGHAKRKKNLRNQITNHIQLKYNP